MSEQGNGNGKPVEVKSDGAKEATNHFVLFIDLDTNTNSVSVKGGIADIGQCYKVLEMAKDCIREWNRLNNGYLHAQPVKKPGIIHRATGGAFGK